MLGLTGCNKDDVFELKDFHAISKLAIGLPPEEGIETIRQALIDRYPGKVREKL